MLCWDGQLCILPCYLSGCRCSEYPKTDNSYPSIDGHGLKDALDYQDKSSSGILDGCIGALDGWLCQLQTPSAKETVNVSAYFSVVFFINMKRAETSASGQSCGVRTKFGYGACRAYEIRSA
jgi:hypothetical protein